MPDKYTVPAAFQQQAHIRSKEQYDQMYEASIRNPDTFWREESARLDWFEPFHTVKDTSFASSNVHVRWFDGGVTNVAHNCIDRHLPEHADRTAFIFEPDDPSEAPQHISYARLHEEVCRFANVLKTQGVRKGDRVTIYLPMIPEAAYAMLACARIGAVHSVVFAGFSPESLANRIRDCRSTILITADEGNRGGKKIPLKANADKALEQCPDVVSVILVRRTGADVPMKAGRDIDWTLARGEADKDCPCEPMQSEDPLFILYTSGSTGQPKGELHTTAGYLLFAAMTHELVFDYHEGDVFWCTADVGWVTGHSYMVYGPTANAATQVFFEGIPTWPDASRFWQIVDKHQVNQLYTAPTAIRALMRLGDEYVTRTSRSSLKLLGTVGEPINPEAWKWYHDVVGSGRCPIVDTWWQTETGGIMISPLPGAIATKPGSATVPFFGVQPQIIGADGNVVEGAGSGVLVLADSWPGQARSVYGDHDRFVATYFKAYEGRYFTGDGCRRDEDGYYWITGRVDDVINVSGHRLGTAEVESALVGFADVTEVAVVGFPHDIKGQGIYCFVTLNQDAEPSDRLREVLKDHVREVIGPIARPDFIQFTPALPKTRSGKIMRRILRKIAAGEHDNLGDISTLADSDVVAHIIKERRS